MNSPNRIHLPWNRVALRGDPETSEPRACRAAFLEPARVIQAVLLTCLLVWPGPRIAIGAPTPAQQARDTGSGYCITHHQSFSPSKPCEGCKPKVPGGGPGASPQNQITGLVGNLLTEMLRGDPGKAARFEAEAQAQALARQRAAVEFARKKTEDFTRLRGQLKLDNFDGDDGGLKLKGVGDEPDGGLGLKLGDDGLKPLGTRAAANSGPPETGGDSDPMVVDLRDLNKAASIVGAVDSSPPEDAPLLFDTALGVANRDPAFSRAVPVVGSAPAVDSKGLLAFQVANNDFRKATDFKLQCQQRFNDAQRRREVEDWVAREAKADLDKATAALATAETLKQKQKLLAEVYAATQAEDAVRAKARAEVDAALLREARAREEAVRILRAGVAKKDPAAFHPPIPSLPAFDEAKWTQVQEKMIAQRAEVELRTLGYRKELREIPVPKPETRERCHEGVLLGADTDSASAREKAAYVSPWSGKTTAEMNEAARLAMEHGVPGVGGAVVVSFGTPKTGTLPQQGAEATRVLGDHFTDGRVSLQTPQAKQALQALEGKEFDRFVAHSNGASVAEALIREDRIKVHELNILGGDRSLVNKHAFQELVDSGKVQRVVVWIHVNDPVPLVTAPDQIKISDRANHALDRIARRVTGDLEGGDSSSRVTYRYLWGQGQGLFGPHYVESYYASVAKEFGTPPVAAGPK